MKNSVFKLKLAAVAFLLFASTIFPVHLANASEGAGGVSVREISNLNIVSDDSTLPVTIVNSTKTPLSMFLTVESDSVKLDVDSPDQNQSEPILVQANSESIVSVPLHARANGTARIHIICRGINAIVYADNWIEVTITTAIGRSLFALFSLFVAALLIFGIYRTFRAHKGSSFSRISSNLFGIKK